jgi:hypothetical protein
LSMLSPVGKRQFDDTTLPSESETYEKTVDREEQR